MPMIVQNKGDKGNPYHDEEGKFTTADDVTDGEHTIRISNPLKISKKIDGQSPRERTELEKYYQEFKNRKNVKPVEEMSQEELLKENSENLTYLKSKGIDFSEMKDLFAGDLKLKCANLRRFKEVHDKMNLDFTGLKIIKNGRLKSVLGKSATVGYMFSGYNSNWEPLYNYSYSVHIEFNATHFSNYNNNIFVEKSQQYSGFSAKTLPENLSSYTWVHEFGHSVHGKILEKNIGKIRCTEMEFESKRSRFNQRMKQEIYNEFQEDNPGVSFSTFEKQTSRYSHRNDAEWFAENYASLMGGVPTTTAKALGKWLIKNGYMKGE